MLNTLDYVLASSMKFSWNKLANITYEALELVRTFKQTVLFFYYFAQKEDQIKGM